jgi:subtilisin family serine protease
LGIGGRGGRTGWTIRRADVTRCRQRHPHATPTKLVSGRHAHPEAQKISTGEGVKVAIVDSGVDPDVSTLRGRVLPGFDFGGGNGQTDQVGHGTS